METKIDISQGSFSITEGTANLCKNNVLKIRAVQHRWFHTVIDYVCSKIHKNKKYYGICRIKIEIPIYMGKDAKYRIARKYMKKQQGF